MMETKTETKICCECGGSMEGKMKKAKFCSDVCRATNHKKHRANLGNVPETKPTKQPAPAFRTPPMQLDALGTYMVEDLKDKVKDLKDEVKKLTEKNEKLTAENSDLLKQVEDTTRTLAAKPSGLGALLQDKDSIKAIAETTMPHLAKYASPLFTALAGMLDPDTKHPLMRWINTQPEQVQIDFINMVGALNNNPDKIAENIANISRALMTPHTGAQEQEKPKQPKQSPYR